MGEQQADVDRSPVQAADVEILTRRHQVTLATIVVICLGILAARSVFDRIQHGRPINIERPFDVKQVELTIDLNAAAWPELTLLPDISETMARRIVEHREQHGRFQSLESIQDVKGIGPRTFARIQPYLRALAAPNSSHKVVSTAAD